MSGARGAVLGLGIASAVLAGVALCPRPVGAEDRISVRVVYAAPARCPAEAGFVDALRTRSRRVSVAKSDEAPAIVLVVDIRENPRGFHGSVAVHRSEGAAPQRAVSGGRCEDVVSGLALIAAVAVDPASVLGSERSGSSASETSIDAAVAEDASLADSGTDAGADNFADAQSIARPRERANEQASAPSRAPPLAFGLGLGAGISDGPSPAPLLVVSVFGEVVRREGNGLAARVRLERAELTLGSVASSPTVDVKLTAASIDVSAIVWGRGALRFEPFARGQAGLLDVAGLNVSPSRSDRRIWLALGVGARGRWFAAERLYFGLEASVLAPLERDRFFVEPNTTVYRPPPVAGSVEGSAGLLFW